MSFVWIAEQTAITLVGISFLPEIILIDFRWEQVHKIERVNQMLVSPFVWVIPVDDAVEWPKAETGGWAKRLFLL
jgi:hypothetical protein